MNKDVIYIDVDDDITAIIGKVKDSKEKIVALVPPKRIGALQSAVNLRLLQRTATTSKKRLVLITNNKALVALAASAKLPVAKNAQSKPEIPEIAALAIDDGDDVINGDELPIGEHARMSAVGTEDTATDKAAAPIIAAGGTTSEAATRKRPVTKKGPKVPNFNTFRKKLVIGGVLGALLVGFLVWAIFFAPRATVVIAAKTSDANINRTVNLTTESNSQTSFSAGTIKAIRQEQTKEQSVDFTATGKKDAGEKATATVRFTTGSLAGLGTIPAGTRLTSSSGLVFVTDSAATLSFQGGSTSSTTTTVTAAENGDKYNAAFGPLSGAPDSVSASFTSPSGGGVTKMVTVVTAGDVQKAATELAEEGDEKAIQESLKSTFGSDVTVIDTSYKADKADPVSSPKVGEEATTAKLTTKVTYSMYGIAKSELNSFLDAAVKESIADRPDQKVYNNGRDKATLTDFVSRSDTTTVSLAATGKVGPQIDDTKIKDMVKGKRFGDIQADIEAIQGVDGVDVKFFPFWVRTVPTNPDKITIEFKVDGEQ